MGVGRKRSRIIIATNNRNRMENLRAICQVSFEVLETNCGQAALDLLDTYGLGISALLLDFSEDAAGGWDAMEKIRQSGFTELVPVVGIMKDIELDKLDRALSLGVSDILQEPFYPRLVKRRLENLTHMNAQKTETEKLKIQASTDPLTKLLNRRALEEKTRQILKRESELTAVCLMDIDNFKNINDVFGHIAGDKVLAAVSLCLKRNIRKEDIIGRVGGDEFVILLRHILSPEDARERMRDICSLFADVQGQHKVSSSVGIAVFPRDGTEYRVLFDKADKALYQAKNMGKNRCILYEESFHQCPFRSSVSKVDGSDGC